MVLLRSVLCLQVLSTWTSMTKTLAAPGPATEALKNAKSREFRTEYADAEEPTRLNLTRNFTLELRPRQKENWENKPFLDYVRAVLATKCPHKPDNKTCADDDAVVQVEDEFDKLNISQKGTIRKFLGGAWDTVTCAQLVRVTDGSGEMPENVACVVYFYDQSPEDMKLKTDNTVD